MGGTDVPIKELPPYLPKAFIAIEDRRFYSHFGVDPIGLARAAVANVLRRGVSQGGSTITQQLAKNLFLTQERTLWRKMQEVVLALWLERKFSKTQILELYLNRVYFGSGAYGVEAAAQRYFGKSARQVTVAEAAMLAGLVKSPSRLAPSRNPDGAERRAQVVLDAMTELGFVTETMAKTALAQPARAVKPAGAGSVNYVADWIMDVLDDLVGRVEQDIVVETSIDPVLQAAAEKALVDELALKGGKFDVAQGAIVAMTPDGAVRALVGGKNYAESQFNRAVAAKRQPGSAFKPFVYLTALERGLTPETRARGQADRAQGLEAGELQPRIFRAGDADAGAGAVAQHRVGAADARSSGRPRWPRPPTGSASPPSSRPIRRSRSAPRRSRCSSSSPPMRRSPTAATPSRRTWSSACAPATARCCTRARPQNLGRIVEPRYVAMMNAMMRETLLSGTAQKAQLPGWPAAGKTGTSQDFRDAWFIGYTGHLVTGVWLGNDNSSPTKKATGGGLPVEIWSRVMKVAHQGVPVAALPGLGGRAVARLRRRRANVPPPPRRRRPIGSQAGAVGARSVPAAADRSRPRRLVPRPPVRTALNSYAT